MKRCAIAVSIICCLFLWETASEAQLPAAEHARIFEPRTIGEGEVKGMPSNDLVDLLNQIEHKLHLWPAGTRDQLAAEIFQRDDPSIDERLIAVFEMNVIEDAAKGRLDAWASKRVGTITETILNILARRRTPRALDYVVSQATNGHPVVRARVIHELRLTDLSAPQNREILLKVMPLLYDDDAGVASRSVGAMVHEQIRLGHISEDMVRALIEARDKTKKESKDGEVSHKDKHHALDEMIKACKDQLTKRKENSEAGEKEKMEQILILIDEEVSVP